MPGRTPYAAYEAFAGPIQDTIGCLASAKVTTGAGGKDDTSKRHSLTINSGSGVSANGCVNGSNGALSLEANIAYRHIRYKTADEAWKISTLGYAFTVYDLSKTAHPPQQLIAFHWHPGANNFPHPHIHLPKHAASWSKWHVPSGRICIEQVIRFMIEELGVEPRRADWAQRFDASQRVHEQHRTWASSPPNLDRPNDS